MSDHVHEWAADVADGIVALCRDPSCHKTLDWDEIDRRLNATERLSPHLMGSLAYDRDLEKHWREAFSDYAKAMYGDAYQVPDEFAAALEGEDD